PHRRVCGDPSAEERCSSSDIQVRRQSQDEMFIDDDGVGVTAIGDAAKVFVRRVESERHVWAELLEVTFAIWAGAVGVDHATNRDEVARLVLSNVRSDFRHAPHDLVTWNDRIICGHELAPLVAHRMEIGMADAAVKNFNLHVALYWIASRDCRRGQRRRLTGGGIGFRFVSSWMHGGFYLILSRIES